MADGNEEFLTTRELAQLLRVKERKVYELVANAQVPCTRATGKLLFPRNAIDRWLSENGTGHGLAAPAARRACSRPCSARGKRCSRPGPGRPS